MADRNVVIETVVFVSLIVCTYCQLYGTDTCTTRQQTAETVDMCEVRPKDYRKNKLVLAACASLPHHRKVIEDSRADFEAARCKYDKDRGKIVCVGNSACSGGKSCDRELIHVKERHTFPCGTSGCQAPGQVGCCNMCKTLTPYDLGCDDYYSCSKDCVGCGQSTLNQLVKSDPSCTVYENGFACTDNEQCNVGKTQLIKYTEKFHCAVVPCGSSGCDVHSKAKCCKECLEIMCYGTRDKRLVCEGCTHTPTGPDIEGSSATRIGGWVAFVNLGMLVYSLSPCAF